MDAKLRKTPFSQVFIDNMDCFPPEQLEKIMSMEPKGAIAHTVKAKVGKILETSDSRTCGIAFFNSRNKSVDMASK